MAAPQGIVRVHQHEQTVMFQVEGWTTMNQSLSFRRCAEQYLAAGAATLWVDLRHCTFMDSTFIGTLLFLKRTAHQQEQGSFALVSPSPQCCRLFQQMGLEGVFPILAAEEVTGRCWNDLKCGGEDMQAFQENVVRAHQELANLDGPASAPFKAVARCLEQELEAEKAR